MGQLVHQSNWLTKSQVQQKFPHLMGELNAMETIPLAQNSYFRLVVFFAFFQAPNFRGRFEVVNDVVFGIAWEEW